MSCAPFPCEIGVVRLLKLSVLSAMSGCAFDEAESDCSVFCCEVSMNGP